MKKTGALLHLKKIIKKGVLGAAISSNVATGGAAAFAYITNPVFF